MADYTISELAALSGLSVRTIRYYQAQGLVPTVGREGAGTRYPERTLARLRLIVRLKGEHLPLAAIRSRLAALTDDEVAVLADAIRPEPAPGSALDYVRSLLARPDDAGTDDASRLSLMHMSGPSVASGSLPARPAARARDLKSLHVKAPVTGDRSQWERIALGPDIEIHVRRPSSRKDNQVVERIVRFARELIEQEEP